LQKVPKEYQAVGFDNVDVIADVLLSPQDNGEAAAELEGYLEKIDSVFNNIIEDKYDDFNRVVSSIMELDSGLLEH